MINPRGKLFRWGPIDGRPVYPLYWYPSMFKWGWPAGLCYFTRGKFNYVCDYKNLYDHGEKVFLEYILPDKEFKYGYRQWQRVLGRFLRIKKRITVERLRKMKREELVKLFSEWNQLYNDFWQTGLLPELANWGGEQILNRELGRKIKDEQDFNYALERLSAPEDFSFYQKEELDLLVLKKIKERSILEKKLALHQRKYFWLLNSYHHTQVLDKDYFRKILNSYSLKRAKGKIRAIEQMIRESRAHKREVIRKFKLPLNLLKISRRLSFCIWWQDFRKSYIFQANHLIDLFLKEFSSRLRVSFSDLHYYRLEELKELVMKKKTIPHQEIIRRQDGFLIISHPRRHLRFLTGNKAEKFIRPYLEQKIDKKLKFLKGLVVSRGLARGIVRIIHSPKEEAKMHQGDILVTPMTSPDYITALRKAAAVVTDEGGLTCHAAIVARELKIPCIVGTKIATKVLKDGDLVEVDATGGIIKKIERKHD